MSATIVRALFARLGISLVLLLIAAGCGQPEAPAAAVGNQRHCVETYDESTDYFPAKAAFEHATGVSVEYGKNTKLVEIQRPWKGADESLRILLVQCGTPAPDGVKADLTIDVPVRRMATFSTTQLPAFAMLDQVRAIVAHGGLEYAATPAVVAAAKAKRISEVGDQTSPDVEALLAAKPDLALLSAGIDDDAHRKAIDAVGVPAVPYADWLEETLLGRAEWLKLVALLTNEEQRATAKFADIEQSYASTIERAAMMLERPKVVVGAPYEGTWFMPAGDSYVAAALMDLGAKYPWAATKGTGALSLDIETVIDRAADADVWIGAGSVRGTVDDLATLDHRFEAFDALRKRRVYAEDRRVNKAGGNALFELGAVRPDLVAADLFKILYPAEARDVPFTFYGRVGPPQKGG